MTSALTSKSFKSAPAVEVSSTMRDLIAAMPIVLLFNAVRAAFSGSAGTVSSSSATAR